MRWVDRLIMAGAQWLAVRDPVAFRSPSCGDAALACRWDAFSRIVSFHVFPVARRLMLGGQPEQRFERNMPVEVAIVAKN